VTSDDRTHILARRAKFIAAALATAGVGVVACTSRTPAPQAVQGEMKTGDAGSSSTPEVASSDASVAGDVHFAKVCLSIARPHDAGPIPISCLSVAYDPDAGPAPCLSPPPGPKGDAGY
jgi:hypothetical protein